MGGLRINIGAAPPPSPVSLAVTRSALSLLGRSVALANTTQNALTFDGTGATRQVIYWDNPPWMYGGTFANQMSNLNAAGSDGGSGMTYVWRCRPNSLKTGNGSNYYNYWTLFFWGNSSVNDQSGDVNFPWNSGAAESYYGAHPYPFDGNTAGTGQDWENSIYAADWSTESSDGSFSHTAGHDVASNAGGAFNQWYDQAYRAWRVSSTECIHEFYWDLRNTSRVIKQSNSTRGASTWGTHNPPRPRICLGQSMWQTYLGDEEWKGEIAKFHIYDGLLSLANIASESAGSRTSTGNAKVWFRNENPDANFTDQSGQAHHPTVRGSWPAVISV